MIADQTVLKLTDTIIAAIPPTLIALGAFIAALRNGQKTDQVQRSINGRMDELLERTRELAHRDGKEAGIKEIVEKGQVGVVIGITPTAKGQEDQKHEAEAISYK